MITRPVLIVTLFPTAYMTSNFKIRFYFNFDDPAEYVYLDNIKVYYMPPDTSITFKINNQQVYLDGNGNPQAGFRPYRFIFIRIGKYGGDFFPRLFLCLPPGRLQAGENVSHRARGAAPYRQRQVYRR